MDMWVWIMILYTIIPKKFVYLDAETNNRLISYDNTIAYSMFSNIVASELKIWVSRYNNMII